MDVGQDGVVGFGSHGIEVRPVLIEDWTGRSGAAAFANGRQVSPVLADPGKVAGWLDANRGLVRGAVERGWDVPSRGLVERYAKSIDDATWKLKREHRKAEQDVARYRRSLSERSGAPEDEIKDLRWLEREVGAKAGALEARIASLQGLRRRLDEDPVSLFLPVGATVRMKVPARPESWAGGRESPPVPGSLGIVVGYADEDREWSTKVAFLEFTDTYGDRWSRDRERPLTTALDADDLEVVSLAAYADGTPCTSLDFVPTHRDADDPDEPANDMVVVSADGAAWQVSRHGEGAKTWLEVRGFESIDEVDHLVPVDAAAAPRP